MATNGNVTIAVSKNQLTAAFAEWDRLWREDPDAFDSDIERILRGQTITEYGETATATLLEMIDRVSGPETEVSDGR